MTVHRAHCREEANYTLVLANCLPDQICAAQNTFKNGGTTRMEIDCPSSALLSASKQHFSAGELLAKSFAEHKKHLNNGDMTRKEIDCPSIALLISGSKQNFSAGKPSFAHTHCLQPFDGEVPNQIHMVHNINSFGGGVSSNMPIVYNHWRRSV